MWKYYMRNSSWLCLSHQQQSATNATAYVWYGVDKDWQSRQIRRTCFNTKAISDWPWLRNEILWRDSRLALGSSTLRLNQSSAIQRWRVPRMMMLWMGDMESEERSTKNVLLHIAPSASTISKDPLFRDFWFFFAQITWPCRLISIQYCRRCIIR
jgi:hypothetical protein